MDHSLAANGLVETEVIAHVTSRLIVNRTALKTRPEAIAGWIARFREALVDSVVRSGAVRALAPASASSLAQGAGSLAAPPGVRDARVGNPA